MYHFNLPARLSTLTLAILVAQGFALPAFAQDKPTEQTSKIERIQVTGTLMQTPNVVYENTKTPRQPLPAHDGGDYLTGITGFSSVRKGGASSDPVFRGLAGSRVNILSDGEPLLGGCESRMDPPTAYISPQSYDRISVVKGPQHVASGPPAAAATVNFERAEPDFTQQAVQGFLSVTGGSYGRAETNVELQTGNNTGYIRGNYTFARSDSYKDGEGQKVHSQYQRWNSQFNLGYHLTQQQTLSLSFGTGDGESAYADRGMDGTSFYRENVALRWNYRDVSDRIVKIQARAYYGYIDHIMDNYKLRESDGTHAGGHHGHGGHDHAGSADMAHNPERFTQGFAGYIQLEPTDLNKLQVGVDAAQHTHRDRMSMDIAMHSLKDEPYQLDAKTKQIGLYAEGSYELSERDQFFYGYRVDRYEAQDFRDYLDMMGSQANPTAQAKRTETLPSGFIRLERHINEATYYAGLGKTTRFPDYWEMIARGRQAEDSLSAFWIEPESLLQLDVGAMVKGTLNQGRVYQYSMNFFANQIDDFILIEQTPDAELTRNVNTQSFGFELDGELALSPRWEASASLSYVRAKNKTDASPLAQQPPLLARFGLNYQLEHWSFGGMLRAAAAQTRVAPNQGTIAGLDSTATAGYVIAALNASWHISDQAQLHVGLDNLLNKQYAEHLSRNAAAIPGYPSLNKVPEPGRNAWVYFSYRL